MAKLVPLKDKVATVRDTLGRMRGDLAQALPHGVRIELFIQVILTSVARNPALLECTPASFYGAIRQCCQLGLGPDGILGEAALAPFKNVWCLIPVDQALWKLPY